MTPKVKISETEEPKTTRIPMKSVPVWVHVPKTSILQVRLEHGDRAVLDEQAKELGIPTASYARKILEEYLRQKPG